MKWKKLLKKPTALALFASLTITTVVAGTGAPKVQAEEKADAEWEEIQSIVGRYYGEWNDASYEGAISDGLPNTALLGNGDVGITSGGDESTKTFYISKGDFWPYNMRPLTLGGITIKEQDTGTNAEEPSADGEFYEKQDILNAEIQTTQEMENISIEMKTWLASDENVLVTELQSTDTENGEFEVSTWVSTNEKENRPVTALHDENSVTVTRSTENTEPDNPDSHISKAALATKIIGAEDVETASDNENGKGTITFTLPAGEKVYIVTAVGGGGRTYHNDGSLWEGMEEPENEAADLLASVADETSIADINSTRQQCGKIFGVRHILILVLRMKI